MARDERWSGLGNVAPADPPVLQDHDYGKFLYQQSKKATSSVKAAVAPR